ncbi:response regulator [Niabella aurantiaca]|uniref:response regulator n=1 Tax=Niabella aurantiaca TaxID=379900 RepID=UPI00036650CF|nr:response regulator transcription factor [Niabella aurantiaca]
MATHKLSVIVVEDHSIIAEGLNSILHDNEELELKGIFATAEEALVFLEASAIDVLLLDISLPEMSGLEMCRIVKRQYPRTKIVALTNHTERSVIQEMLENGADGYLLKNTSKQDLITAIAEVMKNRFILQSELQKILFSPAAADKDRPRLTTREKEILLLVSQGTTTSTIAKQLFISPQTVETHRRNLMQKFEVNNSAALIKKATEKGLL